MGRRKKRNPESWYTCLNCETEFQLYEALVSNTIKAQCPYCDSREFILSKYKENNEDFGRYDYGNYDPYDDYY